MGKSARRDVVRALLEVHGQTYAAEIGFDPGRGRPTDLYRLLCAATLFSTRISADIAVRAARALADEGWTTAEKMAAASWQARTTALNHSGYARYDERTSTMLGDTAEMLLDRYDGDLRQLREEAERDPPAERRLLKECKGIGDVGIDIFFREAQPAWEELLPFADRRALAGARALGLPGDAEGLAELVDRGDVARLVAACVRVDLAGDAERVLRHARGRED